MDPVDKLLAIEAIRKTKATYWYALDMKDWDRFGGTFTDDAILDLREEGYFAERKPIPELPTAEEAIAAGDPGVKILAQLHDPRAEGRLVEQHPDRARVTAHERHRLRVLGEEREVGAETVGDERLDRRRLRPRQQWVNARHQTDDRSEEVVLDGDGQLGFKRRPNAVGERRPAEGEVDRPGRRGVA